MPQVSRSWIVFLVFFAGCTTPDPRTVEGAIAYMADAIEQDDAERLYRVIDERGRHAMHSIVHDRREAARLVEQSYPPEQRESALARLGDAASADSPAALFAMRCDRACRRELGGLIGAPTRVTVDGELTVVTTTRGSELQLYRGADGQGWYGLVWGTEALSAERDRASRDLRLIEENAETYARRRDLETR